ncbi:50S ribosomal protein L17 [bacterium]|nr:50S ribosomal protein L17 [bacterium]
MRHNRDHRSLNRTASHRKAMLSNMVTSLFKSERIRTTAAKAKEARRVAERLITFAKRGDLSAKRHVAKTVREPAVLKKLFDDIGLRFADRQGGYTRILRLVKRPGDNADMALLELLKADEKKRGKKKKSMKKYHKVDIPENPSVVLEKEAREKAKVETEIDKDKESGEEEKPLEEEKVEQTDEDVDKTEEKEEKKG